jgi:hypothetical protein
MKKRSRGPKSDQFDRISSQINSLSSTYIQRLPVMMLAQCPYCATYIWQPVDVFSLMGLGAYLQAEKIYRGNDEWHGLSPYRQLCSHALCATLAVNLNGRMPDDLVGWMIGETIPTINYLTLEPHVMVWPLVARHTSAVLRVLPIGRLDDDLPGTTIRPILSLTLQRMIPIYTPQNYGLTMMLAARPQGAFKQMQTCSNGCVPDGYTGWILTITTGWCKGQRKNFHMPKSDHKGNLRNTKF